MLPPLMVRDRALLLALLALVSVASGCRSKIGGACKVSTDCSLRGDRICDLSFLVDEQGLPSADGKGECIVEGCRPGSCPTEAVCVQVYSTEFLSVACDPEAEGRTRADCDPDEICLPEWCARTSTRRGIRAGASVRTTRRAATGMSVGRRVAAGSMSRGRRISRSKTLRRRSACQPSEPGRRLGRRGP